MCMFLHVVVGLFQRFKSLGCVRVCVCVRAQVIKGLVSLDQPYKDLFDLMLAGIVTELC